MGFTNGGNFYESQRLRDITGQAIRPGGFSLTEKAVFLCSLPKGAMVLDAGCGSGATVEYLRNRHGFQAIGLDLSDILLGCGRKREEALPLIRGDAEYIPLERSVFSALFCECALSITREPDRVLEEFFRVLSPGGFLIITDIYLRKPGEGANFGPMPGNCCLKGARPQKECVESILGAGFTILLWEDHSNLLRSLAAKMVFEFGSLEEFWGAFTGGGNSKGIMTGVGKFLPGYYFLLAKKGE